MKTERYRLIKAIIRSTERILTSSGMYILMISSLFSFSVLAQSKMASRTIISEDGRQEVNYLIGENRFSTNDTLDYYWHYANEIKMTQGGHEGELLDGAYIKFDKNDNLREQGDFKRGLKNGDWKKWSADGKILLHEEYKKGLRNGVQRIFKDGVLLEKNQYSKGRKHGYSILYGKGDEEEKVKYKNGRIKVKKHNLKDSEKIPLKEQENDSSNKIDDDANAEKLRKKAEREKKKASRKLQTEQKKDAKSRKNKKKKINKSNSTKDRK